jgi:hypothetical protein
MSNARHAFRADPANRTFSGDVRRPDAAQEIAAAAARQMAEDGSLTFAEAKRKAAKLLGLPEGKHLPSNDEVLAELKDYQAIFYGAEEAESLRAMREMALELMQALETYRPYLVGRVLNGTAAPGSAIELQLFAESAKAVEIDLINRGIDFGTTEKRHRNPGRESTVPVFTFEWEDVPVALTVFEQDDIKSGPKQSAFTERASVAEVEALLQASDD